ncbi:GerMN domain-containing protein [Paenibacillus sp. GSMTC-2017]|uniref:GerMN domain-containing protein n=1 Tax=Paenibacillus sp. GSMTC-2017 TaxID=2794350 RepID=UPI0018D6F234|nr:GerMN domain-containing protein [Paenibacillus sp. GSMTC-2017]MBH5317895.1 GerMN domain-containing protein [Paenibacillus sp. GSMTC-2017]
MNTANRSFRVLLASTLLAAFLTACGDQGTVKVETEVSGNGPSSVPITSSIAEVPITSVAPQTSATPKPTGEQGTEVIIYRSDGELQKMVEHNVKIIAKDEVELINKTLAEFQKDDASGAISLWKGIHFLSVELKDAVLTLDIHIPDEERLGAPGEQQLVDTLKKTMFQFSFVESLDVLVVGEPVESLMGHVDIEHPIKKSEQ